MGNSGNSDRLFWGVPKSLQMVTAAMIKRCLLLGRKAMTKLNSISKGRDITLPTKVCLFKAMFFPVVMGGCESWTIKKVEHQRIDAFELWCWTIKKVEHQRIDAFELWCWKRLLRVPWTDNKGLSIQSYVFSSSHGWMWELDYKESWAPKNWRSWTMVLEKTLASPLV